MERGTLPFFLQWGQGAPSGLYTRRNHGEELTVSPWLLFSSERINHIFTHAKIHFKKINQYISAHPEHRVFLPSPPFCFLFSCGCGNPVSERWKKRESKRVKKEGDGASSPLAGIIPLSQSASLGVTAHSPGGESAAL